MTTTLGKNRNSIIAFVGRFSHIAIDWLLQQPVYQVSEIVDELTTILKKEGVLK